MNILLSGATGFVGRKVAASLARDTDISLTCAVRRASSSEFGHEAVVGDLAADTEWEAVVKGQQVVIHTAARAHIMKDEVADPLAEYREVNVHGTLNLARQCAAAGVHRFIFISSIKVNGEQTVSGHPFSAEDAPQSEDPYGISKMEAEQGLRKLAAEADMEVVIIRPPMVYGPGVKANFRSMMSWVAKGVPLPLGAINNRRSLVALDNLVDLIVTCIDHPAAANQTFLVSDDEDLSTGELLRRLAVAMNKPSRLFPVPPWMLEVGASLLGKKTIAQRLCGSLQIDITKTKELLNWCPPVTVDEALRRTAESFLADQLSR